MLAKTYYKTLKSFFKKTICKIGYEKLYLTALEDKRHYLTNNRDK